MSSSSLVVEVMKKDEEDKNQKKLIDGKSVQIEERATGAVPWSVYKKYTKNGGVCATTVMFIMFALAQGFKMISDWWIGQWSSTAYP